MIFNQLLNICKYCFYFYFSSRKRRPSCSHDGDIYMSGFRDDEQMNECNAALVLMSLSGSPHSPRPWMLGSSPASNSSGSWTSYSDELDETTISQSQANSAVGDSFSSNGRKHAQFNVKNHPKFETNRLRTASLSTSDEGIVMDYNDETPRKRRVSE